MRAKSGSAKPQQQSAMMKSTWNRFGAALLAALLIAQAAHAGTDSVDLTSASKTGSVRQAKVVVEVEGKLKLNADGKEVKHLPLKVQADLHYFERIAAANKNWSDTRLLRSYQTAEAKIRLHDSELTTKLRGDRRVIAVASNATDAVLYSSEGPLTRDELELLQVPASGLALEALLPSATIKTGGTWPLSENAVARLLNLDAVSQQDVACTLDSVKDNVAIVSLAGKVAGAVGGVSSDIELKGKLNFDVQQKAVTWLTLAIRENRAIGHAQPGYEVLTKLKMASAPAKPTADLNETVAASIKAAPSGPQTLIEFNSDSAGFQLLHDRRWSVMLERGDLTVLRLVDRGDLIAQCNITPLPALAKDQQLSLEVFQADIKRVLGKNFEELVEAAEETTESGLRVLRVVAAGAAGELPIQWTYYHLSDDAGHRASLVFTIESSVLSRFAHIDRELIGNFHFAEDKNPTPAGQSEPAPRGAAQAVAGEREARVKQSDSHR
jgi:hypothetical protein